MDARDYECNFNDIVADCDWNPRYNMFTLSGFGQEFPILVYAYERSDQEVEELLYRHKGQLKSQIDLERADLDDPQNEERLEDVRRIAGYGAPSENLNDSAGSRGDLRKGSPKASGRKSLDYSEDQGRSVRHSRNRSANRSSDARDSDGPHSQKNVRFAGDLR